MIETVLVVIPANNEQAAIGACLDALLATRAHARQAFGGRVDVRAVVVLDSCIDATEDRITPAHDVQIIHARLARAGAARALGVAYGRGGLDTEPDKVWIASTDADSRVPLDWITTMVRYAERGADVALGTVRPDVAATSSTYRQWRRRYVVSDGHPHVHGANLGLRADVYDRIGGWPLVAFDEDVELVRRAENHVGVRVLRTGAIPVVTSARLVGRAPHGFAGYLRRLPPELRHDKARLRTVLHAEVARVESEG
jgi:cellulose synthase/poly-beta-1,6-N-acetylglucosamine synthase-like glycosyltransferase